MKFLPPAAVLALLSLASCATYSLQPLAQDGASVRAERSKSWSVVKKDGLTFEVAAQSGWEIQFDVRVTNGSGQALTLDAHQFKLYSGEPKSWSALALVTPEEVYRRAEAQERNRVVMVYTNDAPVYTQQTTTTTIGGNGSSMTIIRTEQVPQPAPQVVTVINPGSQQRLDWLKAQLLYTATVEPGKSYQGLVYGESDRASYYKLVIPVNGKDWEFVFQLVKDKGPFKNLD